MTPYILLQIIFMPAVASIFIFLTRPKIGDKAGWVAGLTLLYTTILLLIAGFRIYQGEIIFEIYSLGPKVNLNLLADGLSLPVALIMNMLCAVLAFYSIHYVDHRIELIYGEVDKRTWLLYYTRFFWLFLLFATGFAGVAFSTNLIAMYFFLELLTIIPLYFIMAQFGYSDYMPRYKVALLCIFWGVAGATLFLIGVVLAYTQISSFEIGDLRNLAGNPLTFWIILLILLGMATKLALVPFHVWMPWVHAEHPTCIAGLLAVYANIAAYVIVRVLILPLPNDFQAFGMPLMVIALITMIYGSLFTMAQTDVKRIAACSTISQIGYSIFGLGALTVVSIEGGMFFFLSHIMGKTIFFSTAGILVYATGTRDIRQMGGLASKMPITAMLWTLGAMSLSGFPPFSSFAAEWIMFTGIFQHGVHAMPTVLIVAILGVSTILLTVCYTFWAVKRAFFGPVNPELLHSNHEIKDPPLTMSIPLLLIAAVSIILGVYPKPMIELLHSVIGGLP
ncbi:MAG: complex I subunit 4 family protein [Thermodesulfovibrionales bacterium]